MTPVALMIKYLGPKLNIIQSSARVHCNILSSISRGLRRNLLRVGWGGGGGVVLNEVLQKYIYNHAGKGNG